MRTRPTLLLLLVCTLFSAFGPLILIAMRNNKNPLFDLLSSSKNAKLKPTATVVRGRGGSIKIEREDLLSDHEKEERSAASLEAGTKRGEQNHDPDANAGESFAGSGSSRVFPSWEGSLYEFVSDGTTTNTGSRINGYWELAARSDRDQKDSWRSSILNQQTPSPNPNPNNIAGKPITVATFNVWFAEHEWKKRTHGLLELLVRTEYIDVVCLQEVTPRVLEYILRDEDVRTTYYATDKGPNYGTLGAYGVTMLIRKSLPLPTVAWVSLPTTMGRSALVASFGPPGSSSSTSSLAIATVHLESLASQETRTQQLKRIKMALQPYATALLLGDYNITPTGPYANPEEHRLLSEELLADYEDVWIAEHGTDGDHQEAPHFLDSITFNPTSNTMMRKGKKDHSRYDRVFARSSSDLDSGSSSSSKLRAHRIRLIGNQPIGPNLFISDHFGLALEIGLEKDNDDDDPPSHQP